MIAAPKTVSFNALLKAQPCRKTVLAMIERREVGFKVANRYLRELAVAGDRKRFHLLDLVREEVDTPTLCELVSEGLVSSHVAARYLAYRRSVA